MCWSSLSAIQVEYIKNLLNKHSLFPENWPDLFYKYFKYLKRKNEELVWKFKCLTFHPLSINNLGIDKIVV